MLQVICAFYGLKDVTGTVRSKIKRERLTPDADDNNFWDTLTLTADNDTFWDTWSGKRKTFMILYRYDDGPFETYFCEEHESVLIWKGKDSGIQRVGSSTPRFVVGWYGIADVRDDLNNALKSLAKGQVPKLFTSSGICTIDNRAFSCGDGWPSFPHGYAKTCPIVLGGPNGWSYPYYLKEAQRVPIEQDVLDISYFFYLAATNAYDAGHYALAKTLFEYCDVFPDLGDFEKKEVPNWLGWIHEQGQGTAVNETKAVAYYRRAKAHGHKGAARQLLRFEHPDYSATDWATLGYNYQCGSNGYAQEKLYAYSCYEQALVKDSNHGSSLYYLGLLSKSGVAGVYGLPGVEKNATRAEQLLVQSANSGFERAIQEIVPRKCNNIKPQNAEAWFQAGEAFAKDQEFDYKIDLYCYQKAKEHNPRHVAALHRLGEYYALGRGVAKNEETAQTFYKNAGELGYFASAQAYIELAHRGTYLAMDWLVIGRQYAAVEKHVYFARVVFEKIEEMGCYSTEVRREILFQKGRFAREGLAGISVSLEAAQKHFEGSARLGHEEAAIAYLKGLHGGSWTVSQWFNQGQIYFASTQQFQQDTLAQACYRIALRSDPGHVLSKFALEGFESGLSVCRHALLQYIETLDCFFLKNSIMRLEREYWVSQQNQCKASWIACWIDANPEIREYSALCQQTTRKELLCQRLAKEMAISTAIRKREEAVLALRDQISQEAERAISSEDPFNIPLGEGLKTWLLALETYPKVSPEFLQECLTDYCGKGGQLLATRRPQAERRLKGVLDELSSEYRTKDLAALLSTSFNWADCRQEVYAALLKKEPVLSAPWNAVLLSATADGLTWDVLYYRGIVRAERFADFLRECEATFMVRLRHAYCDEAINLATAPPEQVKAIQARVLKELYNAKRELLGHCTEDERQQLLEYCNRAAKSKTLEDEDAKAETRAEAKSTLFWPFFRWGWFASSRSNGANI